MAQLKKNTASQTVFFGLVKAIDGTALTGATVTVYVCKDGTQSTAAGSVTETAHGGYSFAPTQADTNGTNIGYIYTATSAIPVYQNYLTDVVDANGYASVNVVDIAGTAQTARDIGASVLLSAGTGAGQLDFTSGVVKSNATQILGTTVSTPATAGILDVNVKNMNNVAGTAITTIKAVQGLTTADTIATYTGNTVQTGDAYARLGAPAGASVSVDIATATTDILAIPTTAAPTTAAIASAVLTTTMTEAYPTQGTTFSLAKGMYQLVQQAGQMSIIGTIETVKKRDGATTAKTFTLDSATSPTTISETT